MEKILAKLSPKPHSSEVKHSPGREILAKLSEQQVLLDKQKHLLVNTNGAPRPVQVEAVSSPSMSPLTPATESLQDSVPADTIQGETRNMEATELFRLRQELLAANSKIALQEQELAQTRVINHTLDQALGPPSEVDFNGREVSEHTISHLQNAFNASNGAFNQFHDAWNAQDDSQSDISDALSAGGYNKARGFWAAPSQQTLSLNVNAPVSDRGFGESFPPHSSSIGPESNKFWGGSTATPGVPVSGSFPSQRVLSGPSSGTSNFDGGFSGEQARYLQGPGLGPRRSMSQVNRGGSCFPTQSSPWGTLAAGVSGSPIPKSPANRPCSTYQQVGLCPIPPYNPRPIGTPLSATASEFTSSNANPMPWTTSLVSSAPNSSILSLQLIFLGWWKCYTDARSTS